MSNMKTRAQSGEINVLLIPFILVIFFFFGAAGFGMWAYSGRQDYKNNVDQKISVAVAAANQKLTSQLDAQFAQKEKYPLQTYSGPEAFGTLKVTYPKTWSAYVAEEDTSGTPIQGYFTPGTVPDVTNTNNNYALQVEVLEQTYDTILQAFQGQTGITVTPYALPKVPSVVGVQITGAIEPNKVGTMIILPLRSQTLEIWTESNAYQSDFDNIILPNFSFSP
jgi:hypothetical protein